MIEIRELIIKAVVTKSAGEDPEMAQEQSNENDGASQLDQLTEVLRDKNER
jgi:hypothetical protein